MTDLDRRLNAVREDLADEALRGRIPDRRFAAGRAMRVTAPVADLRRAADPKSGLDTQLILGDAVRVFDSVGGCAWIQGPDGYVGYIDADALGERAATATHRVAVPRSFVYPGPDLRLPRSRQLSMGCAVNVIGEAETRGTRYLLLEDGSAMIAGHLVGIDHPAQDYVSVAESLVNTPYLWGGNSGFGIDCSGLVQLSMRLAGKSVLRDTDMQEASIGSAVETSGNLSEIQRGDLVFWKGHVAIVTGPDEIIHANGHTMMVTREALSGAIARIGYLYGGPTSVRRPA